MAPGAASGRWQGDIGPGMEEALASLMQASAWRNGTSSNALPSSHIQDAQRFSNLLAYPPTTSSFLPISTPFAFDGGLPSDMGFSGLSDGFGGPPPVSGAGLVTGGAFEAFLGQSAAHNAGLRRAWPHDENPAGYAGPASVHEGGPGQSSAATVFPHAADMYEAIMQRHARDVLQPTPNSNNMLSHETDLRFDSLPANLRYTTFLSSSLYPPPPHPFSLSHLLPVSNPKAARVQC